MATSVAIDCQESAHRAVPATLPAIGSALAAGSTPATPGRLSDRLALDADVELLAPVGLPARPLASDARVAAEVRRVHHLDRQLVGVGKREEPLGRGKDLIDLGLRQCRARPDRRSRRRAPPSAGRRGTSAVPNRPGRNARDRAPGQFSIMACLLLRAYQFAGWSSRWRGQSRKQQRRSIAVPLNSA